MNTSFATPAATARRKEQFEAGKDGGTKSAPGNFRQAQGIWVSTIGLGTYLGKWDESTDEKYVEAILLYLGLGGNVIDTAANYRFQRSEKCIGRALEQMDADRGEVFLCTKAGYLPFDGEPAADVRGYFEENFVNKGIAGFDELVGGSHCMAPKYLQSQIDQSLTNMKVGGIDLFYIHNPEAQLAEVDRYTFEARIAAAFELLEQNRASGKISFYGIATWNGFRAAPDEKGYHSLERFVNIAKQVAGDEHGFKFIQVPHNLAMPEAYLLPNQAANGKALPTIAAAAELGVSVMVSASLLQGKLSMNVPLHIRETFGGLTTDAMTSLQFVRSTPGVTTALVGMSSTPHVEENLALARVEPAGHDVFNGLFDEH